MNTTTTTATIVQTPRGPSIDGSRTTVYSVMDLIKAGRSRQYIAQMMLLTKEQVDAVFAYVEQHRDDLEAEYARILQREAVARAESERIMRERSPYPPDISWEEKRQLMLDRLEAKKKA